MLRFFSFLLAIFGGVYLTSLAGAWWPAASTLAESSEVHAPRKVESIWITGGDDEYEVAIRDLRGHANLIRTADPLDLAILGEGYFQVIDEQGTEHYTRRGNLCTDENGYLALLADKHRMPIVPLIFVPPDAMSIHISKDGTVEVPRPGQSDRSQIGAFLLAKFEVPQGLTPVGSSIYRETKSSGTPICQGPEFAGFGSIRQGCLETSSLDLASAIDLFRKAEIWLESR